MNETSPLLLFFDENRFLEDLKKGNQSKVFKNAIGAANQHFNTRFFEGEHIDNLVHERAMFIDRILRYAWRQFPWDKNICLVAVGGYGRGELHPHSDIDLLILMRRNNQRRYRPHIESFLTFLWDIQLKIGHSVRSISDCVEEAKRDITVATTLMENRLIDGNYKLLALMQHKTGPRRLWRSEKFFLAKRNEQLARHAKHGNTEYNLEPNIKEAPGGLRDIQTINWVAKRHYQVNSLEALTDKGFLTADEYMQLKRGQSFLWKVRYGVHLLAERSDERLLFDYQRKLANLFGFKDSENRMGVEKFMQQYYQTVLMLRELNDAMLQYLDEVILNRDKVRQTQPLNARFQVKDNYIETVGEHVFVTSPSALLEIFCLLGEHSEIQGIRAATIRQIRRYRGLIDDSFRNNPYNKALFMRLLSCPNMLSLQLQRMTRYGVLGRYLPEFGRIIGQMQHDLFHIYPVDAHTLQVIKNMRRFDRPEVAERFPVAAHTYKNLPKPELLYIAGLYHDIAKGRRGDHSTLGAEDVARFASSHGLSDQETRFVSWLVENHLLMSSTSQREDISDPEIIHKFATIVGDQLHLDYLFVLTVADITATNPTLWTSWKGSLMHQLYIETRRVLERGLSQPVDRFDWAEETKRHAIAKLQLRNIHSEQVFTVWGDLDEDFFIRENAADIARYTEAIIAHGDNSAPVILIKNSGMEVPVATQIFIHTKGLNNVFPITAACLDQLRLNIQDARLHSNSEGNSFDTFYVLDEERKPFGDQSNIVENIEQLLSRMLQNPSNAIFSVHRRTSRQLKHFTLRTSANISNDINLGVTLLEVITPDRPGLLAHLGRIFMRYRLRLQGAKIATLGERVEDLFYLTDFNGKPLSDPALCKELQQVICQELDSRNQEDLKGSDKLLKATYP